MKLGKNCVTSLFHIIHQANLKMIYINANNPFLTAVLGDFNVKSNFRCKSNKTSYEGSKIEGITSKFGLY